MNLVECERRAIDDGAFDKATFDLVGPNKALKCRWLDAYFGFFLVEGSDGFVTTKQFDGWPIHCANYQANTGVRP